MHNRQTLNKHVSTHLIQEILRLYNGSVIVSISGSCQMYGLDLPMRYNPNDKSLSSSNDKDVENKN